MAKYVQSVLTSNENIIYEAEISIWAQSTLIVLGIITLPILIGFVLGFVLLLSAYLNTISTELAITNKRVIAKFGFIRRRTTEINLSMIESIHVHQGLLGRIFNFGSLVVSGAGAPQAPIPGICRPLEFRKKFMEAQEQSMPKAA